MATERMAERDGAVAVAAEHWGEAAMRTQTRTRTRTRRSEEAKDEGVRWPEQAREAEEGEDASANGEDAREAWMATTSAWRATWDAMATRLRSHLEKEAPADPPDSDGLELVEVEPRRRLDETDGTWRVVSEMEEQEELARRWAESVAASTLLDAHPHADSVDDSVVWVSSVRADETGFREDASAAPSPLTKADAVVRAAGAGGAVAAAVGVVLLGAPVTASFAAGALAAGVLSLRSSASASS